MAGIALSRLNITPVQFYDLTPLEFGYAIKDHSLRVEANERFLMEMMRLQTAYIVQPHIKDKIADLRKFMPFESDKIEVFIPTNEDWTYYDNLIKKWHQKQSTN